MGTECRGLLIENGAVHDALAGIASLVLPGMGAEDVPKIRRGRINEGVVSDI
jgi:hypothetical protein